MCMHVSQGVRCRRGQGTELDQICTTQSLTVSSSWFKSPTMFRVALGAWKGATPQSEARVQRRRTQVRAEASETGILTRMNIFFFFFFFFTINKFFISCSITSAVNGTFSAFKRKISSLVFFSLLVTILSPQLVTLVSFWNVFRLSAKILFSSLNLHLF